VPTFSLRNLFTFVFASCVYLVAWRSMIMFWPPGESAAFSLPMISLIASWILLAIVYIFWRSRSALIVHVFGPLATGAGLAAVFALDGLPEDASLAETVIQALAVGCSVSTLFSFPTTTLILLVLAASRRPAADEPPTRG
jgi:hypothetical protein